MCPSSLDKRPRNEQPTGASLIGSSRPLNKGAGANSVLWHAEAPCAETFTIN
jgi:hypothetical protein